MTMLNLNEISYSNERLEIICSKNILLVHKTFRKDLDRAKLNVEKQSSFCPIVNGETRISSVDVSKFTVQEDRADLLMPYVEGITGAKFAVLTTPTLAEKLSSSLTKILYTELNKSIEMDMPSSIFINKIESVLDNISDSDIKKLVSKCRNILQRLPEMMKVPVGPCHGDLTLSNVILTPMAEIKLIDFLHTFLESPLQDAAKLIQDFVYGWSFRRETKPIRIKSQIISHYHFPKGITHFEKFFPSQLQVFTLVTLARIAPYIKDDLTKEWLVESLNNCIEIIESKENIK